MHLPITPRLAALFALSLLGCNGALQSELRSSEAPRPAVVAPAPAPVPAQVRTFADAVKDAAIAEPSEISTRLTAITDDNPTLVWKGTAQNRKVLLVTWTSWNGYDDKISQAIPLAREVWVSAVPELRNFCKALPPDPAARVLRLEQLLGLPAQNGKDRFVELWADPNDLFRPCPDPEINDHECTLDFPRSSQSVMVSAEHTRWFNDLKGKSYGDKGYPWTRLGYTFDWGSTGGKEGLSEFVIRAGASVEVRAVEKIESYCR